MKKVLYLLFAVVLFSATVNVSVASESDDYYTLDLLKTILTQARTLQQKIIAEQNFLNSLPYKITLLYPNGGEDFRKGSTVQIKWNARDAGISRVNIYLTASSSPELINERNPGILIANNVPVDISYAWTIPSNMQENEYYILIRDAGKGLKTNDFSDNPFKIISSDIKSNILVPKPKKDDILITGRTYHLEWKMIKGGEKFIDIRLVKADAKITDTDTIPAEIEDYIPSSYGSYDWVIPKDVPSGDYKLKYFGVTAACTISESVNISFSEPFKIIKYEDLPKKIKVLSLNSGSDIEASSTQKISWFTPFDSDHVDVFVRGLPSGHLTPLEMRIETGIMSGKTEIDWMPKTHYGNGKDERYFIRVCRSYTGYCAENDNSFVIISKSEPGADTNEPKTEEYNSLRSLVDEVKNMVSPPVVETETVVPPVIESVVEVPVVVVLVIELKATYLPYTFVDRLSYGMENDDRVRALQEALRKEGLFSHSLTGNFYDVTKKSVEDFQTKYGLEPSGSVGPGTQAKLNELYSGVVSGETSTSTVNQ